MKRYLYLLILIFSLALFSCRRDNFRVNVAGINVNIELKRLEVDLFSLSPGHIADSTGFLKQKYDGFLKYFGFVINIGQMDDSTWTDGLVNFCTDKTNNEIFRAVLEEYPSTDDLEKGIKNAFRHYRYYFPDKKIPGVYTCITGFNNSIITGDSVLGISLDRYLGPESSFYKRLQIYKYQAARMKRENILPDAMYGWGASEWDYNGMNYTQNNVLSDIIHEGKLLYFVKSMIPDIPDELIFGFTAAQLNFCINNEGEMWQYLAEHNLLFSSDMLTRKKLTGEAPFTTYFSSESPGRAAAWIGFRIVESYMSRNRSETLEKLMGETDVQSILEKAAYRPVPGKR